MAIVLPKLEMVPVDFGWLSELPKIYQQRREQEDFKAALGELESADPASRDAAIRKLYGSGPQGALLAIKMEDMQRQREATQALDRYHTGQLDVARGGLGLKRDEARRSAAAEQRAIESGRALQDALRAGPPLPPEDQEPTVPSSKSQPTVPQGTPTDDSLWDLRTKTPAPQSALPPTGSLASTGAMQVPAELADLDIPQDVSAAARGPQYAQAPGTSVTDAGSTGLRPTPSEQEGPGLRQPTAREKAIATRIQWLQGIASQAAGTDQEKAIDKQITFLGAELKELRTARQKALEKQEAAILARENRAASIEEGPKKAMLEESIKASGPREQAQATLGRMWELSRDPTVVTGEYGLDVATRAKKMAEVQQALRAVGLEGVVPQFIKDFAKRTTYDPGMRYEEFKSLSQQLVQARTADKVFDKLSNDDRKALERSVPSEEDPPQVQQSKVAMLWAYEDRKADIADIRIRGINAGLNTAQIEENVKKFNQKYSLTQDSKEKLIQLRGQGREGADRKGEAQKGAEAASQAQQPAKPTPSPAAIKYLRDNPGTKRKFIETFGQEAFDALFGS
jgi:hypothetical protein